MKKKYYFFGILFFVLVLVFSFKGKVSSYFLCVSVLANDSKCVEYSLLIGGNPNCITCLKDSDTPILFIAGSASSKRIYQLLLENGADPQLVKISWNRNLLSYLILSCSNEEDALERMQLSNFESNLIVQEDSQSRTPVMYAVSKNYTKVLSFLIRKNQNSISIKTLEIAVFNNHLEVLKILISSYQFKNRSEELKDLKKLSDKRKLVEISDFLEKEIGKEAK